MWELKATRHIEKYILRRIYNGSRIMNTAKVFQSGNSQAVRLPKAFRFNATELEIFRRGDEVVLREKGSRESLVDALKHLPPWPDDIDIPDLVPEEREGL